VQGAWNLALLAAAWAGRQQRSFHLCSPELQAQRPKPQACIAQCGAAPRLKRGPGASHCSPQWQPRQHLAKPVGLLGLKITESHLCQQDDGPDCRTLPVWIILFPGCRTEPLHHV